MINKIQKVGKVAFKTHLIINQNPVQHLSNPEEEIKSIHSYFVMLRHIFQKNKQVMRKRNQFSMQNKSDSNVSQTKSQQKQEGKCKIIEQSFGILKNQKVDHCNILKQGQRRNYRPYRAKHRSPNLTAKGLSSSVPNIQPEKDDTFKPIGEKYQECKAISSEKKPSIPKQRAEFATCINFYPRYQKKDAEKKATTIQFNKNQLKKQRRTLLVSKRQTVARTNESQSLRSSHKSAYSNKSCLSMATEASQIPSPW